LIWQSYYLLKDTLRYETPKVVVLNTMAMQFNAPVSEAYNRLNIDGMRLSPTKLQAAEASMLPEENLLSYIFPIARYHGRWSDLNADDLKYFFWRKNVSFNGYMMHCDVKPVRFIRKPPRLSNYKFGPNSWKYLDMIRELCREKGIALLLVKAPTVNQVWYPQWNEQIKDYADQNGLQFINMVDRIDEVGIDNATDTYDEGLHLNVSGAEKEARYLGKILTEQYGVKSRADENAVASAWEKKAAAYAALKSRQEAEIAETGKSETFTW
jgi:hypothetical protein